MESAISDFSKTLATFCNHVETSTQALSDSIRRRPIPLDSAASAFLNSLDRRISSTTTDLNLLDSMALGTVSFAELLGHCNEVYKTSEKFIAQIEDRMKIYGYVPELDNGVEEDLGLDSEILSPETGSSRLDFTCGSVLAAGSNRKELEDELSFEDSFSLHNLGLSDTCLATLALEDKNCTAGPTSPPQYSISPDVWQPQETTAPTEPPKADDGLSESNTMIKISKDVYESLPSYMKSLASWEELQGAVVKLTDYIRKKESAKQSSAIGQHDLDSVGLGHKGRSYLLILLRMKQLVVENVDGSIEYRVCIK